MYGVGARWSAPLPAWPTQHTEHRGMSCTTANVLVDAVVDVQHTGTGTAARRRPGAAAGQLRRPFRCHGCSTARHSTTQHDTARHSSARHRTPTLRRRLPMAVRQRLSRPNRLKVALASWGGSGKGRGQGIWVGGPNASHPPLFHTGTTHILLIRTFHTFPNHVCRI